MVLGSPWRLLFVDDDPKVCQQVKDFLQGEDISGSGERPEVEVLTNFDEPK